MSTFRRRIMMEGGGRNMMPADNEIWIIPGDMETFPSFVGKAITSGNPVIKQEVKGDKVILTAQKDITAVGTWVFQVKIKEIFLPSKLETFGGEQRNSGIEVIHLFSKVATTITCTTQGVYSYGTMYVPKGMKEIYEASTWWTKSYSWKYYHWTMEEMDF